MTMGNFCTEKYNSVIDEILPLFQYR